MPYELSFRTTLPPLNPHDYINPCCVGGDLVIDCLMPAMTGRYSEIQSGQEDWGWFIWMRDGKVRLAIDVFTEDEAIGLFRVHLTSNVKRWFRERPEDTPELERLQALVSSELGAWVDSPIETRRLDANYM